MTTKLPAKIAKSPKVYKNKNLNSGNFADFNLNDYQVFLHLISKIEKKGADGNYLTPILLQREHELTAIEFAHIFNISPHKAYGVLNRAVNKLMKTDITIQHPDIWNGQKVRINICSMAKYQDKEGKITVEFTDRIMPHLAQVKEKFVIYNLKEIANFGSLFTTRLYELIQEFKDTGVLLITVEKLREAFAVGTKHKLYAHFKDKTFAHACDEINEKTDYGISFTEIKTGRKVTSIQFEFKKTVIEKRFKADGSQVNNYIKPKHNSDKIEAAKAIETPKKPAPIIMQKPQKPHNPVAVEAIKNIRNMLAKK
jgi:plasmid replication initiation protein